MVFGLAQVEAEKAINLGGIVLFVEVDDLVHSGQNKATSHDRFPPNGGLVRDIPGYFREI